MPIKMGMAKRLARRKRLMSMLLAVITLPLTLMLVNAGPAGAAVKPDLNTTMAYSKAWTFHSAPLKLCAYFEVKGSISYTETVAGGSHGSQFNYTGITVKNPVVEATMENYNGTTCSGSKSTSKWVMAQSWSGYSCSFNPSISVSAPWGISLSFWPSCSNRDQASYGTSYGSGTKYAQNNSGFDFSYGNYSSASTDTPPCYGVRVTGTAWEGNTSDNYQSGSDSVCLKSLGV